MAVAAWVEVAGEVATLVAAVGTEATSVEVVVVVVATTQAGAVVVVATTQAGAVVADTSTVEAAGDTMPAGIGMVVGMSAGAATITSTSFAGTTTISIIALLGSELAGGPATIATRMAMAGASI